MQQGKSHFGFYSLVAGLNIAVALMFQVVSLPPPRTTQAVSVPMVHRKIAAIQGIPSRIVIASLSVDLPVGVGSFNPTNGTWTLADDRAFYADNSVPVNNNNGTTLIYGHARSAVFGSLKSLQAGAIADIYTDNGRIFHYRYRSLTQVSPTDTSVFTASGPPTLLLQTCGGAWDMYRSMYAFDFVSEARI